MADRHKRTTTAIRFPDDVHDRLAAQAAQRDLSINVLVVRAAVLYLDELESQADLGDRQHRAPVLP